jgi:hypothetical protein
MNRPLWTPAQERLRRVRGWYDAALAPSITTTPSVDTPARVVYAWGDRSGLANKLEQATDGRRPEMGQINGRRAVKVFQYDYEYLTANAPSANPYSVTNASGFVMFCVFRADVVATNGTVGDGAGTYLWDRYHLTGRTPISSLKVQGSDWCWQTRTDGGSYLNDSPNLFPVVLGKTELVSLGYTSAAAVTTRAWRDGKQVFSASTINGAFSPELPCFGKSDSTTITGSSVSIGEWVIINDANDTRLRQQIEGYLAHKWGVRLSSGHPYAFAPPMVGSATSLWPLTRYTQATLNVTARRAAGYLATPNPRLPILR